MSRVPDFARHAWQANAIPPVPMQLLLHRVYMHKSNLRRGIRGRLLQFDCDDVTQGGLEFRATGNDVIAVSQHTKRVEKEGMANFARITPVAASFTLQKLRKLRKKNRKNRKEDGWEQRY